MRLWAIAAVIAVVSVGLTAGLMVGTGMNGATERNLPETSWTLRFQAEDRLFAKAMPPIYLATLLAQVVAGVLNRGAARGLFAAASVLMVATLLVTVLAEVLLNKVFQAWTAGQAPGNWTPLSDRWLRNHAARTLLGMAAFVCSVCGLGWVR
jgi:hypothetical protein